jgi:hypothetical protein
MHGFHLLLLNLLENVGEDCGCLHVGKARLDLVGIGQEPEAVADLSVTIRYAVTIRVSDEGTSMPMSVSSSVTSRQIHRLPTRSSGSCVGEPKSWKSGD